MTILDIIHVKKGQDENMVCYAYNLDGKPDIYKWKYKGKSVCITKRCNDNGLPNYWGFLDDDSGKDICVVFD